MSAHTKKIVSRIEISAGISPSLRIHPAYPGSSPRIQLAVTPAPSSQPAPMSMCVTYATNAKWKDMYVKNFTFGTK